MVGFSELRCGSGRPGRRRRRARRAATGSSASTWTPSCAATPVEQRPDGRDEPRRPPVVGDAGERPRPAWRPHCAARGASRGRPGRARSAASTRCRARRSPPGRACCRRAARCGAPPDSPIAVVTPSNRSRCSAARKPAPYSPVSSSSATKARTRSRARHEPVAGEAARDGQHHRVHVLHVERAAAPHRASDTGSSTTSPANGSKLQSGACGRHDVEVSVHEQAGRAAVAARDAHHRARAARARTRAPAGRNRHRTTGSATHSAAGRSRRESLAPKLEVSNRISAAQTSTTSSSSVPGTGSP